MRLAVTFLNKEIVSLRIIQLQIEFGRHCILPNLCQTKGPSAPVDNVCQVNKVANNEILCVYPHIENTNIRWQGLRGLFLLSLKIRTSTID